MMFRPTLACWFCDRARWWWWAYSCKILLTFIVVVAGESGSCINCHNGVAFVSPRHVLLPRQPTLAAHSSFDINTDALWSAAGAAATATDDAPLPLHMFSFVWRWWWQPSSKLCADGRSIARASGQRLLTGHFDIVWVQLSSCGPCAVCSVQCPGWVGPVLQRYIIKK